MKDTFSCSPSSTSSSRSPAHHSFSEPLMEENNETAEAIIKKWNPESSDFCTITSLFTENRQDAKVFLKCVKDLRRAMHILLSQPSNSEKLENAQNLMQKAMKILGKEFYQILITNRNHLHPESISGRSSPTSEISPTNTTSTSDVDSEDDVESASNSITDIRPVSTLTMNDLRAIADCMMSTGYGKECAKIYKSIRKPIIDESLHKLGVKKMSRNQIQKMDWGVLEFQIKNWLNAVKMAMKTIFHGEKILCDHVFSGSETIRDSCFSEISREGATKLFSFPELVANCKKSPEKMFHILDLYDSISELRPEIDSIFTFESTSAIRLQALTSLERLGDSIRSILTDFESAIHKDTSKSVVPGGGIHPLTRYVMNYICFLSDYGGILSDLMAHSPFPVQEGMPEAYFGSSTAFDGQTSAIAVRFAWLILVLLCKLDAKTDLYTEVSLSYLFLANNLHYVVSKVRSSNLRLLLGDDWLSKHEIKVKRYAASYERMGWSKVMSSLPDPTAIVSQEEAKECFKSFNLAFETTYRLQSSWVVSDGNLRDDIKVSLCKKIVPAYRMFDDRYRAAFKDGRNVKSVVQYAHDDLTNYLSDLFYGTGALGSSPGHSRVR